MQEGIRREPKEIRKEVEPRIRPVEVLKNHHVEHLKIELEREDLCSGIECGLKTNGNKVVTI